MECDVCEQPGRRELYCEVCLKERQLIHRSALKRLGENHEATVNKALPILTAPGGLQDLRIATAQRAKLLAKCQTIESQDQRLTDEINQAKTIIQIKRTQLFDRRNRLKEARQRLEYQRSTSKPSGFQLNYTSAPPCTSLSVTHLIDLRHQTLVAEQHWGEIIKNLTIVRRSLISQLSTIYPITHHKIRSHESVQTTGRLEPSDANEHDTTTTRVRSEWRISGLCLPSSSEVNSYPREEISAATLHTSHFLRLAAMYLGVKLPLQISFGPALSISAPRHSVWKSKFPALYPLHLPVGSNHSNSVSSMRSSSQVAFLTGLSMLAYNTYYLFETQRLNPLASDLSTKLPPAHEPRDVLQSLYACSHSLGLGVPSHVTGKKLLKRPGSPSQLGNVDLTQLVNEALHIKAEDMVEEEWNLI